MTMPANIIVGTNDGDLLEELRYGAEEIARKLMPRRPVAIVPATSIDEVQRERTADTLLLIVAAALPQGPSGDAAEQPALDFVRSLEPEQDRPPCILVTSQMDHVFMAQRIKGCEALFVNRSTDYVRYCVDLARKLGVIADASSAEPPPRPADSASVAVSQETIISAVALPESTAGSKFALIEVDLPTNLNMAMVRLEIHANGRVDQRSEASALQLKKSEVLQLMTECKSLKKKLANWYAHPERLYDRWQHEYKRLADRLGKLLWRTESFSALYDQGFGTANGNVRVRFNLERPWFDGLWEALPKRGSETRCLMLDNTITRRARQTTLGLFPTGPGRSGAQGGALRILAIASNVENGAIPESKLGPRWKGGPLRKLGHLDDEIRELRALSGRRIPTADAVQAEVVVDVLPAAAPVPGSRWSLMDDTKDKLTTASQGYDIVHFAGHAIFAEGPKGDGRGYLVFSGHPRPQAVPIQAVATWLADAGVQLVYLSCCRSSAALVALEFARNNIPMAIGFHWDVDDSKAPVFAKEFYQELLKSRLKVCPAISRARLNLFNGSSGGDPIWASPVLIAQPMDWIQVEGVLKSGANPDLQAA